MPNLTDAEHGAQDDLAAIKFAHRATPALVYDHDLDESLPVLDENGQEFSLCADDCQDDDGVSQAWPCLPWHLADRAERAERERDEYAARLAERIRSRWSALQDAERERDAAQAKVRAVEALRPSIVGLASGHVRDVIWWDDLRAALADPEVVMSTYLYLVCLDHDPPLVAGSESGQHLYDLPQIRSDIANRQRVVDAYELLDFGEFRDYFGTNTARFLNQHQSCAIGIVDEYGRAHPTVQPEETPA